MQSCRKGRCAPPVLIKLTETRETRLKFGCIQTCARLQSLWHNHCVKRWPQSTDRAPCAAATLQGWVAEHRGPLPHPIAPGTEWREDDD
jgi:hypothetical protein